MSLLKLDGLHVDFQTDDGLVPAVRGLDFELDAGASLGIVGESGSGKSQTALAIMGLLSSNGRAHGCVEFDGKPLLGMNQRQLNAIRGPQIGMIFQDPMTCLNPHLTVGLQMAEVLEVHCGVSRKEALQQARSMLDAVNISAPTSRLQQYPHELSGGMRQRVMIAMALLCRPRLLIADEPTTALDVTVQAQILDLLGELQREFSLAILLITHDLGVVAELCDQLLVMYAGKAVEQGETRQLLRAPSHPYTRGLLGCRPRLDTPAEQRFAVIKGQPIDPGSTGAGCAFADRCDFVQPQCRQQQPGMQGAAKQRRACHYPAQELINTPVA